MRKTVVQQVEAYIKKTMKNIVSHHDFKHVDRVRNWALQIAEGEGFKDLELVEVTALLHDIGLAFNPERSRHGQVGAEIAGRFLAEKNLLPDEKISQVTEAIRYHTVMRRSNKLLDILQDADRLEALGAVGIMRAFTSKSSWPEYNPSDIKGAMWGISGKEYGGAFIKEPEEKTIIDQLNFQIHYYDNLATRTARELAKPFVVYMKKYILQLEHEILSGRKKA